MSTKDISLSKTSWILSSDAIEGSVPFPVPGDVHSALLAGGKISDPYWRDAEFRLDWIHEASWVTTTSFNIDEIKPGTYTLTFDSVDCVTEIRLNGQLIGSTESQFLRYDLDATKALKAGENKLEITFFSSTSAANAMAEESEIVTPYMSANSRIGNLNYLRKTQCHGGWDWNIALSPIGLYGDVVLRHSEAVRLDDVTIKQRHEGKAVELDVTFSATAFEAASTKASVTIDGNTVTGELKAYPGAASVTLTARVDNPRLWWPAGQGAQELYDIEVTLGDETRAFKIGLRDIKLDVSEDEIGNRFAFVVNGRDVFMKGANWIPGDALPARADEKQVRDLLQSAVDANMNMLRVWGGGEYEADWFYELCDELGIMIWQDFMFACHTYPAHDREWLNLVRTEARQQLRRLSRFACMAVWCGDNELVGALNWYPETKNNRDRYLAIYDRLNHSLEEAVEEVDCGLPFWPSSPSKGRLDFGDGWHVDTSGDMHFWDVWHSAKDFEHYRTVRPRFCSEFGYQSFPSMRVIESFTEEGDRNVSSSVMDVHQRNDGGNSRIVETIARYFTFPDGFSDMVYLSQLGQALAMKTSNEFWRSNKPRTMGVLYWQLNDTWPVASWASLEYGGGWKATQYMARRFFAPILVTAQPDPETGDTVLWGINDTAEDVEIELRLRKVDVDANNVAEMKTIKANVLAAKATELARVSKSDLEASCFLIFDWKDATGTHVGENDYLPLRPKRYNFGTPEISVSESVNAQGVKEITLSSDKPALFVTYDHGGDDIYSDNCFTLLPNEPKTITVARARTSHLPERAKELRFLIG